MVWLAWEGDPWAPVTSPAPFLELMDKPRISPAELGGGRRHSDAAISCLAKSSMPSLMAMLQPNQVLLWLSSYNISIFGVSKRNLREGLSRAVMGRILRPGGKTRS